GLYAASIAALRVVTAAHTPDTSHALRRCARAKTQTGYWAKTHHWRKPCVSGQNPVCAAIRALRCDRADLRRIRHGQRNFRPRDSLSEFASQPTVAPG